MFAPSRSSLWLVPVLAILVAGTLLRAGFVHHGLDGGTDAAQAMIVPLTAAGVAAADSMTAGSASGSESPPARERAAAAQIVFSGPLQDPPVTVVQDTLGPAESIYLLLHRCGLSEARISELSLALATVFDSRAQSRPGDHFRLVRDTSGVVLRFRYAPRRVPEHPILVERRNGALSAQRLDLPLRRERHTAQLEIRDNLSHAVAAIGEGDALTDLLADEVFGALIDFRREQRRGDRIDLVFEKLLCEGRFVRYGHILAARYKGQVVSQTAFRFTDAQGRAAYYDTDGRSLARQFLLYALPYRGITSHFNPHRLHPVLKRVIPHLGTDYAAAMGTKAWATGRGRVLHAGWKGALGKAVIIRHPNGYVTRYGHLSRVLVRTGQQVVQRQIIGRVGATGRVTGPHLHYEIIRDGRHLNPEHINKGTRGEPLQPSQVAAFQDRRDQLLRLLDGAAPPAPSAAATRPLPDPVAGPR